MERKVWDVNVLAIYLVEDHPGNPTCPYGRGGGAGRRVHPGGAGVAPQGLLGAHLQWGIGRAEAAEAAADFLRKYEAPKHAGLRRESIEKAFELADEFGHYIYDCAYLALALQEGASAIVTTDTDFERLAPGVGLRYENPVPPEVPRRFSVFGRQ